MFSQCSTFRAVGVVVIADEIQPVSLYGYRCVKSPTVPVVSREGTVLVADVARLIAAPVAPVVPVAPAEPVEPVSPCSPCIPWLTLGTI